MATTTKAAAKKAAAPKTASPGALDLSAYEVEVEPPELTAFKQKVIEEATKHSTKFHCGSISEILRPLGLDKRVKKITVKITTALGFVFDVQIEPSKLIGKTEAEQKDALAKEIGDIKLVGQSATGAFVITGKTITAMEHTPDAAPVVPDDDDHWYFYSVDGRVKHYFRQEWDAVNRGTWDSRVRATTACGKSTYYPARTITHWNGSYCADCRRSRR